MVVVVLFIVYHDLTGLDLTCITNIIIIVVVQRLYSGVTTHTAPQLRHIKLDGKNLLTLFDNNSQIDASEANVCESTSHLDRALGCYHTGHSYLYWRSGTRVVLANASSSLFLCFCDENLE